MPKGKKVNLLPEVNAYGLSNDTRREALKSMYTPEWWKKSSGRAELTDSPIDMVLMTGPVKGLSKVSGHLANVIERNAARDLEWALDKGFGRAVGKEMSPWWDAASTTLNPLLRTAEKTAVPIYGLTQSLRFMEPKQTNHKSGGKMYFLGSDLSFTDFMKNNPAGISAIGAAGANQQLQPMGQAQSATLQLAPNNHAGATSNDPSVSPSGKGVLNAVMPGAGEILGAVSGTTNSLVNMFDKPGGSMVGAAIKGAMSGNPFGAPLAMMQLRQQRKEEQRLYNQASLANYASGTQAINPMMHTYTAAHGGFISPITEFNGGGTHEENPLGGIPQGYNRDNGAPNLVESRETKSNIKNVYSHHPEAKPTKNYIFSDRGVLEDPKAFGLGGNLAGKTFADAHKKLSALAKERPFDKLANDTLAINTGRLKDANDAMIAEKDFEASNPAEKISHYNQKDRLGSRSIFKYGGFIFKDF